MYEKRFIKLLETLINLYIHLVASTGIEPVTQGFSVLKLWVYMLFYKFICSLLVTVLYTLISIRISSITVAIIVLSIFIFDINLLGFC